MTLVSRLADVTRVECAHVSRLPDQEAFLSRHLVSAFSSEASNPAM